MYWYYFQSARGIRITWKEWVTRFQIIQFIIDLGFVYFAAYTYFTSTYYTWMPNAGKCAGEEFAAFSGMAVISSYLVLFISFYLATYKKDKKAPSARKSLRKMSQAPLPDPHVVAQAVDVNTATKATGVKTSGVSTRSRKA